MLKHLQDLLKEYETNNKTKIDNLKKRATFEIEFAIDHIINNYIEVFDGRNFKISKCSDTMIENCKKGINFILIKADFLEIYNTFTGDFVNIENGVIGIKNNDDSLSQLLIGPKFIDELKKKIDSSYIIEFVTVNDYRLLKIQVPQNISGIPVLTPSIPALSPSIPALSPISQTIPALSPITQPSIPILPSTFSSISFLPTFNTK